MIIDPSTATLELLNSYAPLTNAASDGICLADELPTGITDDPRLLVLDLVDSPASDTPIYEAVFALRCYGPSFQDAYRIYQRLYALLYDEHGLPGRSRVVLNQWVFRNGSLSKPRQRSEPDGWRGYAATLTTRWNLMEVS